MTVGLPTRGLEYRPLEELLFIAGLDRCGCWVVGSAAQLFVLIIIVDVDAIPQLTCQPSNVLADVIVVGYCWMYYGYY